MNIHNYTDLTVKTVGGLLQKRGVSAALRRVVRGPRTLTIDIRLADQDMHLKAADIANPLALAVAARDVITYPYLGVVRYEVQLPEEMWRVYGIDELASKMAIGITSDKKEIGFSLGRPTSLVIGESGSGKSNLVNVILAKSMYAHTADELRIGIVDPHGGFSQFGSKSHMIGPPAQSKAEIADVFGWFAGELEDRKAMGEMKVKSEGLPLLWLVADECSSYDVLGEKGALNEQNLDVMRRMVKEGRKFGLRTLLITQKPTEADMPGILSIATNRFVGRISKSVSANLSNSDTAQPYKLTGSGDFFHISPTGAARFQAALLLEENLNRLADGHVQPWPRLSVEDDFEESSVGRPRTELEPHVVAYYMKNSVSRNDARNNFGIGHTVHKRYQDFADVLKRELDYEYE